jgi:hypothetical protein
MHRILMLAIAAVPLVLTSFRTPAPSLIWWTTTALDKVRPSDSPPENLNKSVSASAARNEFEPFQIVLRAVSQQIDMVDVEVSDLTGPQGAVISKQNFTVYFERFLNLKVPSSIEGRAGEWPDPLIPKVDRYFGEKRNAFPFTLSDNRNQPIWIDLYVPSSTPPGSYRGNVNVTIQNKIEVAIPVQLEVWNFTLPSTSTLPTSFGFSGISAARQHFKRSSNDDEVSRITFVYQKAALLHRLSIYGGTMRPPPYTRDGENVRIDWRQYDAEVGPFMDGTALRNHDPLTGARATTIDMRFRPEVSSDELKIKYWRAFAQHFHEKGWFNRLFNYVWDEPRKQDASAVAQKARTLHAADAAIRNMVTAQVNPAWDGLIDIWTPLINCFERRHGFEEFCDPPTDRAAYEPEIKKGKSLWWYQSCASHGCNTVGGMYFAGWPSYMIDVSPIANRIMEWMTWKYGMQGELYYSTVEGYNQNGNPWEDVNRFSGNGDGTLFYPGTPERVGGKTHIPIESIRLKLIREGLEDYEYLHMLGSSPIADTSAKDIVRKTYDFEHDPAKFYAARRAMGEELNRLGGAH